MSSSTDNSAIITPCAAREKKGDGAREDIAAKQLTLQIEDLSIEKKAVDVTLASTNKADNNDKITTICVACGKEGEEDSMNICNKCKMVHYCNAACKKKHKSKHKKKCDRRVAELHDEELFKDPPAREECTICMLPLPLEREESTFEACCGKLICNGCIYTMAMEDIKKGKEFEEFICAFCRAPPQDSDEAVAEQIKRLTEKGNADAFCNLACYYSQGIMGVAQDEAKANELYLEAGELGCAEAYSSLGYSFSYGRGVETDKVKAKHYYEIAAMKGDVHARHNLGALEGKAGNHQRAKKHIMISARAGHKQSLEKIKEGFMNGLVTKDEYGNALRAYQERQDKMKSDARKAASRVSQE